MRPMRIEIAVAALMLASLLGYAVGYLHTGGAAGVANTPAPVIRDGGLDT